MVSCQSSRPVAGIIGAMEQEVAILQASLQQPKEVQKGGLPFLKGKLDGTQVVIVKGGIGKVNAAMTTILLIEHFQPRYVLFSGIAGAIDSALRPGDIVIGSEAAIHDFGFLGPEGFEPWQTFNPSTGGRNPLFFPGDSMLIRQAQAVSQGLSWQPVGGNLPQIRQGVIVTGSIFVASPAKRKELASVFHADAVEMEGAAVAQVCYQMGTPFLLIRSISDRADGNASVDYETFLEGAAGNAAMLVIALIHELSP